MKKYQSKTGFKKVALALAVILFLTLFLAFALDKTVRYAEAAEEQTYHCTATLDDNFAEDKIIVVMKKSEAQEWKDYAVSDFSESPIVAIEELSQPLKNVLQNNAFGAETNNANQAIILENYRTILRLTLQNAGKQNVLEAVRQLEARSDVLCAEPDYILYPESEPDDAMYQNGSMWGLSDPNYGIHAPQAWDIATGSPTVKVGILDTGIDATHPDLCNRVNSMLSRDLSNVNNNAGALIDTHGHGTHVAGTIGAQGNNAIGVTGVNWNVDLISLKLSGQVTSFSSELVAGVNYAAAMNIPVLNNSNGLDNFSGSSHALEVALKAYSGLYVTSAGNAEQNNDNNPKRFPSNIQADNLIAVGALGSVFGYGDRSTFSNYGLNKVNIYAPGYNILSTFPTARCINGSCKSRGTHYANGYHFMDGTSMATPHVTGLAALMLSVNPNLTGAQLKSLIVNNSDNITISTPDGTQNVKKLNAYKAVLAAQNALFQTNDLSANTSEITGLNRTTLEKLNIPASLNGKTVVSIGTNAFKNNANLEKVILPESVTNIKSGAFSGCNKLKTVLFGNRDSVVTLGTNCFQNTARDLKLLVASDLYSEYRSSTGGQAYADKFVKTYSEGEKLYYEEITAVPGEEYFTCNTNIYAPNLPEKLRFYIYDKGMLGYDRNDFITECTINYSLGAYDEIRLAIEVGEGVDCLAFDNNADFISLCPYEEGYIYVPLKNLYERGETEFYLLAIAPGAPYMEFYASDVTIQLIHKIYL